MNKAIKDLIGAAKEAVKWMKEATVPNEVNGPMRRLQKEIKRVEQLQEAEKPSGYLLLLERGDGKKRITATIESDGKYLSRVGWAALGVDAEVTYSAEVSDLDQARESLKTVLPKEQWFGQGMTWSESSRRDLIAAIKKVKAIVNRNK